MNLLKYIWLLPLTCLLLLSACDDDSTIGSSIAKGEVTIEIDSLFTVTGKSVRNEQFDSRSGTLLLGRFSSDQFGTLDCSFASQLMPASELDIPDSIPLEKVTGMKLKFNFSKSELTGDSLAPQQLTVYRLQKQLPQDINNLTDLTGYYDEASPLGRKTFTAAQLGQSTSGKNGTIAIELEKKFAQDIVNAYRTDASVFATPEAFAAKFAGLYVKSTFGRGLVINMSSTVFTTYYNYTRQVTVVRDGVSTKIDSVFTDSTTMFSISPEVLSANIMKLTPAASILQRIAQGECVLQSPGGYNVQVRFPADQLIQRYNTGNFNLSVINSLTYEVPARAINNEFGLTRPPHLLMIKTSKLAEFFLKDMLPEDNSTDAFWAAYNSKTESYTFSDMREYIVQLMRRGAASEEDMDFTIVPVNITSEATTDPSTGQQTTTVTACDYYIGKPSMCLLDIPGSKVRFTYSRQILK